MVELIKENNTAVITITEPTGVEDGDELKKAALEALETAENVKLLIRTEQSLHVSCCLIVYSLFANKENDCKKNLEDENEVLSKSFSELGLKLEYEKIININ